MSIRFGVLASECNVAGCKVCAAVKPYAPARPAMTRIGVSVDELANLIDNYLIQAAVAMVRGDEPNRIKYAALAQMLREELELHEKRRTRGDWRRPLRQILRWLFGAVVAVAMPLVVVCFLLGALELGSVIFG